MSIDMTDTIGIIRPMTNKEIRMTARAVSFGERIRKLRGDRTLSEVARAIAVTRQAISQWELGGIKGPRPDNLLAVADYFAVSIRWLVTGRDEAAAGDTRKSCPNCSLLDGQPDLDPNVLFDATNARAEFSKRLNELCDEKGLPPKGKGRQLAVGKLFGVSQKGARKWLEGEAIPDTARMPQFSTIFDCNVDWLLAGRGAKRDTAAFNPEMLRLAEAIASLPSDKKGHLSAVVDAFVNRPC